MSITNERQLNNSKKKLAELEAEYRRLSLPSDGELQYPRQLTLRSMGRLMKQLKEEIAQYESRKANPTS